MENKFTEEILEEQEKQANFVRNKDNFGMFVILGGLFLLGCIFPFLFIVYVIYIGLIIAQI